MTHLNLTVEVQGTHILIFYVAPALEQNIGNRRLHGFYRGVRAG
jgi:hypothetical protein